MTFKPSNLPQLVVAYEAHFGTHVPLEAMKVLQPADLVALIQKALATNTPLAATGWGRASPMGFFFSPRGCCMVDEPTKGPDGKLLH
jgi:hypothetical protein